MGELISGWAYISGPKKRFEMSNRTVDRRMI